MTWDNNLRRDYQGGENKGKLGRGKVSTHFLQTRRLLSCALLCNAIPKSLWGLGSRGLLIGTLWLCSFG